MTAMCVPRIIRPARGWRDVWVGSRRVEVLTVGTGTPLIFLHGWGLSPRSYEQGLTSLSGYGHQVIAPSLPGFGRSSALSLRNQNVDGVAAHVIATLERLTLPGPVDVVAHSFGGGVAMKVAATRPDLVKSLTLVCPVGGAGEGAVPLVKMLAGVVIDSRHKWIVRAMHDLTTSFTRNPTAVLAAAYAAWRSDQMEDLRLISENGIPVRFLFADADDVVTPGGIPACAFDLVTCEVTTGRHSWLITEPTRFAAAVAGYLAGPASDAA